MKKNVKNLSKNEKKYFQQIKNKYGTLCFCDRWIENDINNLNKNNLNKFVHNKVLDEYETIYVPKGHYVSQFEHNIFIKSNGILKLTENKYY